MNIFQKGFNSIVEFANRKGYTGIFDGIGGKIRTNYTKKSNLDLYEISLYLNKAVNKRADALSEIQFYLKNTKGEKIDPSKDKTAQKILNLLAKPNNFFTGKEFFRLYQQYKDICGQAFIVKSGVKPDVFEPVDITKLHLLLPTNVKVKIDKEGEDYLDFEYTGANGNKTTYNKKQVIRSFYPNPSQPLTAESIITSGIKNVITGLNIDDYQTKVLENGGRVETVFKFKTPKLTKIQLDELKKSYDDQYAEAQKSGKPMFLGGDSDMVRVGLNPAELAYLESKNVNLNDICIMTGVPKVLLANVDDIKYSNSEESKKVFMKDTVVPMMRDLCTKLNEFLIPKEYELDFIDPTPEDREEKRKDLETADKINCLRTNEKRQALGLEAVPEGEEILVPMNYMPLKDVIEPAPATKGVRTKSPACRQSGETKNECVARKVPELVAEGYSQDEAVAIAESLCKKKCKSCDISELQKKNEKSESPEPMLRDEKKRRAYFKIMDKKLTVRIKRFKKIVKAYFEGQKERVLQEIGKSKAIKADQHFFNDDLEISIAIDKFYPALLEMLKEAGEDAMSTDYDFNLSGQIRSWLDERVKIFSTQINETTFKELEAQFEESLTAGETRQQLRDRIEETYKNIEKHRAETIARTEVHGAMQKGTFSGYEQSGLKVKIWVAVLDKETRDSHWAMDGEEVGINSPFSNGLMFPSDPSGSPEEVINCRCTI